VQGRVGGSSVCRPRFLSSNQLEFVVLCLSCTVVQVICTRVFTMSITIDLDTSVQLVYMQFWFWRRRGYFVTMHGLCTRQVQGHTGIYMYTMSCRHVFEPRTIRLYAMCPGQDRISRQENLQRMPRRH
jgi:hypothetical protein